MLIFWKARLVLLSVPKTGTTALEQALADAADIAVTGPPGLKHCTVRKYRRELARFVERGGDRPMELVAAIREPISWLGSWYRYRTRPALKGHENSTAGLTFDEFVTAYLSDAPPPFARVGSQARFLEGGIDHLFRYEETGALAGFLADRLGLPVDPDRVNVSPGGRTPLSTDLDAQLRKARRADFDLWDKLSAR